MKKLLLTLCLPVIVHAQKTGIAFAVGFTVPEYSKREFQKSTPYYYAVNLGMEIPYYSSLKLFRSWKKLDIGLAAEGGRFKSKGKIINDRRVPDNPSQDIISLKGAIVYNSILCLVPSIYGNYKTIISSNLSAYGGLMIGAMFTNRRYTFSASYGDHLQDKTIYRSYYSIREYNRHFNLVLGIQAGANIKINKKWYTTAEFSIRRVELNGITESNNSIAYGYLLYHGRYTKQVTYYPAIQFGLKREF